MPDRYIHESLLTSDRFNDLDDAAQMLFVRLLLLVDDFGCFDGRVPVIVAQAYSGRRIDVKPMLDTLVAADMLIRYSNAGKPYVAITRWRNELRGKRKFPAPPICNDISGLPYRGKYSRPIGWANPASTDLVSILLDAQMRPEAVQPPEWRMVHKDCAPADMVSKPYIPSGTQALSTTGTQALHTNGSAVTDAQAVRRAGSPEAVSVTEAVSEKSSSPESLHGTQGLHTTTTANGGIEWDKGEWRGLTDAQCARWQEMFSDLALPDQLDRAAAWLSAQSADARKASLAGGGEAFLVRWLLRESRGTTRNSHGGADA